MNTVDITQASETQLNEIIESNSLEGFSLEGLLGQPKLLALRMHPALLAKALMTEQAQVKPQAKPKDNFRERELEFKKEKLATQTQMNQLLYKKLQDIEDRQNQILALLVGVLPNQTDRG